MERLAIMNNTMNDVFKIHVIALNKSSEIRRAYKDIAFRMAAYTSDVLPAAGSRNRLIEKKDIINKVQPLYFDLLKNISMEPKLSKKVIRMRAAISENNLFFEELDQAYEADNRKAVLDLLQIKWPVIQSQIISPLEEIYALHVKLVDEANRKTQHLEIQTNYQIICAFFLGVMILLFSAIRMKRLSQELLNYQVLNIQNSKLVALGEMSAGIAHEINNPLSIISGTLGLITKFANDPEKLAQKIENIQKACNRITKIVGGLKKFSRTSEKNNYSNYSLYEIVKESLVLTDVKSKQDNTHVSCDLNSDGQIFCDQIEIEQVLINMINNAIDAVKTLPVKWVKVELFDTADSLILRIIDSGSGIPENVRSKLFDPFFTTKKVGEGTGLGLSITKGILDDHKATIRVVAHSPNTCFEIRFPKVEELKIVA